MLKLDMPAKKAQTPEVCYKQTQHDQRYFFRMDYYVSCSIPGSHAKFKHKNLKPNSLIF